ncbi:Pol I core factor CF [Linnemannia gamsii]|uniref:Pol I core factor CF n=1 Tax=Linnemannia gamsii TaxID=64522 RepID=A0A9P6ULB7_9FUNG|nr:Pol I core factor CF [Linnemannia gamsii]
MSETAKRKKPVCPTCRSTRWRKNSLGQYVCEGGHVLEGHQEEEGEFAEGHAGYERKLTNPKKKKKDQAGVYHGVEATTLVLRCVQYILQLQAQAMVRDLGFPRDITGVIQEYWSVYVSYLVDYHDGGGPMLTGDNDGTLIDTTEDGQDSEVNTGSEVEESSTAAEFKDKTEPATPTQDLLDTQKEFQQSESESSDDDDDDDNVKKEDDDYDEDNVKEEDDDYDEDKDHGNKNDDDDDSESDGSGDDEKDGATATDAANFDLFEEYEVKELVDPLQLRKRAREAADGRISKRRKGILRKRDRIDFRFLAMRSIIGILYISSQHLKLPVVIGDFQRWIMRHDIPFFNAIKLLPKHMEKKLPPTYRSVLQPIARNPEALRRTVNILLQQFEKLNCIGSVLSNTPRLIARFLHELMLPVECYSCAVRFYHIVYDSIDSQRVRKKLTFRSTLRGPDRAMAITIVVAKLIYGLYGEKRNVKDWEYWINGLPTEKEWISSLDSFDALRRQCEIPYMHGVVDKSFKTSRPGSRRTSVSEGEQSQLSGETSKKPQTQLSSIVPFIQRLCSTVQPADGLTVQEGPLPQQKFVHYLDDPRGQFLGKYGRLLSYASNILCVSPEHLENEVRFIEEHLIVGRK